MKRKGGGATGPRAPKRAASSGGDDGDRRSGERGSECDCEVLAKEASVSSLNFRLFKNFRAACTHYAFPGSHQVGSYGPKGAGITRTYSNATPGKDLVLDGGQLFLYRLKDEAVRAQFKVNQQRKKPVRVFRKVSAGVIELGHFQVEGFERAGAGDEIAKFGGEFVRFVRVRCAGP